MALSGSFVTNTYTDPDGDYKYLKFAWTATQSVANNQSTISWTLTSYGNSNYQYAGPFTVVIDGSTVYSSSERIQLRNGTQIASGTKALTHTDTGTRSFEASVSAAIYYSTVNTTGKGSFTLDTINRKSTVAASSGTLGTAQTLTVTRYNSSFTHTITYTCGTASGTICTKSSSTSISFTPPLSLASQAPSATSVTVKLTITTYSGSTSLGSNSISINCSIPSSVKPSCSIAVSDPTGYASTYGKYIQGKSQLQMNITASGTYGSSITQYSTTAQGKTYSADSITIDPISESADFTVNTTVRDSRTRTATDSETIPVYAYSSPVISELVAKRCTADGTLNASGAYLKLTFNAVVTSLDNQNTVAYEVQYKKKSDTEYTTAALTAYANNYSVSSGEYIFAADTSSSYDIILTATDAFGSIPSSTSGASIKKFWSWLFNGLGFALGKIAEIEYLFDSAWRINSDVGFSIGNVDIFSKIYPPGSIYMSINSTNPANLFGGTWEQLQNRFLLGAGSTYTAGATGGEATHTLITDEMPRHKHSLNRPQWFANDGNGVHSETYSTSSIYGYSDGTTDAYTSFESYTTEGARMGIWPTGGDQPHNNMPPYLVVYMWKRTA